MGSSCHRPTLTLNGSEVPPLFFRTGIQIVTIIVNITSPIKLYDIPSPFIGVWSLFFNTVLYATLKSPSFNIWDEPIVEQLNNGEECYLISHVEKSERERERVRERSPLILTTDLL